MTNITESPYFADRSVMTRVSLWSTLFSIAKVFKSAPAVSCDAAQRHHCNEKFAIARQQVAQLAGFFGVRLQHAPDALAVAQQRGATRGPQRRPETHAIEHVLVA